MKPVTVAFLLMSAYQTLQTTSLEQSTNQWQSILNRSHSFHIEHFGSSHCKLWLQRIRPEQVIECAIFWRLFVPFDLEDVLEAFKII